MTRPSDLGRIPDGRNRCIAGWEAISWSACGYYSLSDRVVKEWVHEVGVHANVAIVWQRPA